MKGHSKYYGSKAEFEQSTPSQATPALDLQSLGSAVQSSVFQLKHESQRRPCLEMNCYIQEVAQGWLTAVSGQACRIYRCRTAKPELRAPGTNLPARQPEPMPLVELTPCPKTPRIEILEKSFGKSCQPSALSGSIQCSTPCRVSPKPSLLWVTYRHVQQVFVRRTVQRIYNTRRLGICTKQAVPEGSHGSFCDINTVCPHTAARAAELQEPRPATAARARKVVGSLGRAQ